MSESVIYDARFLWVVRLSCLRASSRFQNLHPISPWPKPWTLTSPKAKTPGFALKNRLHDAVLRRDTVELYDAVSCTMWGWFFNAESRRRGYFSRLFWVHSEHVL